MLIGIMISVLVSVPLPMNINLIVRGFVLVYVHRVYSWKIQLKNVRLIVIRDMPNLQADIVLQNVLVIHRHLPLLLIKCVSTSV